MAANDPSKVSATSHFVRVDERFVPESRMHQLARARLRAFLLAHPRLFWTITPLYRSGRRVLAHAALRLSHTPTDRFLQVDRLVWVSPSQIEFTALIKGSTLRGLGNGWVLDGDWDTPKLPFARDKRYRSVRDVITESKPWQETEEYANASRSIEAGLTAWYCSTREELDERCRTLDCLIEKIRSEGYLSQKELRSRPSREATLGTGDEITVAIGRHGDVFFRDGAHRLAMAKELGLSRIPVHVAIRHSQWQELRREIGRYADDHGGRVPQPLSHADLEDIPALCRCDARCRLVVDSLPATGTVLDLTPGWGYFCHRLEDRGYTCTALEPPRDAMHFLTRLRRASHRQFTITPKSTLTSSGDTAVTFDAGLVLSDGLDSRTRPSTAELLAQLATVRVRELFVEPDAFAGRSIAPPAETSASELFLGELSAATGLQKRSRLGATAEAGPLYRLH